MQSALRSGTVVEQLEITADAHPEKPCLVDSEAESEINYSELLLGIRDVARMLRSLGVGEGDRVALMIPNSPEFVVAYFGTMLSGGIVVPINPLLKPVETERILSHSGARAVIGGSEGLSIAGAVRSGGLAWVTYRLTCILLPGEVPGCEDPAVHPGDALMMYTSGTTGQPKGVMIRHQNLLASVHNIGSTYDLVDSDVSLCVLPLTHIHGQIASMVTTLCTGGTLVLPRSFNAVRFWTLVRRYGVTWFTAVPTAFTILLRRAEDRQALRGLPLRFARTASAPLPRTVLSDFEELVGCPLVEAYGLTEATHQAASNPLPPGERKLASVGLPTGIDLAAVDGNGVPLPVGQEGELVLRGESITRGYFRNDESNASAFLGPWFRTGDLGHIDEEGYVFITGRKKEQINRGGQKISPQEVDEVLYRHPKVMEAAAVGVPHPVYGEEVEAFVVLIPGQTASEKEIMGHCANDLADYKCPKAVHFVSELPRSASGKIQRLKLLEVTRRRERQE